jgi:hypothetical protein
MSDWGLMPDEINEKWTEERLALMFDKRNERIRAMNQESKPAEERGPQQISDMDFFQRMGVTVGRV